MTRRYTWPKAYFIATNGKITVWRAFSRNERIYRSVVIKEFTRAWHAALASGERSYPTVKIKPDVFNKLLLAKVKHGRPEDDFVANEHLPPAVRAALDLGAVDDMVDQIEGDADMTAHEELEAFLSDGGVTS